jgi:predicted Fe-Mo cluster-binding NifX family protein
VVDAETGEVQESEVVENPHAGAERGKGLLVGRWLLSFRPDEVVVAHGAGRTAAFVLREAGVRLVDANGSVCEAEPEAEGAPEDTAGA